MNNVPPNNGPSDERLAALARQLPGIIKQLGQKLKRKKPATDHPIRGGCGRFPCAICGNKFRACRPKFEGMFTNKDRYCPNCVKLLEDGCTALVTLDNKSFWIGRLPTLPDMAGKMVTVKTETMELILKEEKKRERANQDDSTGSEPEKPA